MLRITQIKSPEDAVRYFTEGLARPDYYQADAKEAGLWAGKGASMLNLGGEVSRSDFAALARNEHPVSGGTLTGRMKRNRRAGYDFTFSAPKSLSILFSIGGDERIRQAFDASLQFAMNQVEIDAATRVRKGRSDTDRTTGNLVWARFVHDTARPVNGISDPQLHGHCVVFNVTYDDVETTWKALQAGKICKSAPHYETFFHADLAARIRGLGYETVEHGRFWEIGGINRDLVEKFSTRTKVINAYAAKKGIVDPDELSDIGRRTRRSKSKTLGTQDLRRAWSDRLTDGERARIERIRAESTNGKRVEEPDSGSAFGEKAERRSRPRRKPGKPLNEVLDHAIGRVFERSALVPEQAFVDEALRISLGRFTAQEIRDSMRWCGVIVASRDGCDWVTTEKVMREEKDLIKLSRDCRGRVAPLGKTRPFRDGLDPWQTQAVNQVMTSRDRLSIVEGRAGSGKSKALKHVVDELRVTNPAMTVTVLAPTARASRGILREEGYPDATTVTSFLGSDKLKEIARRGLIWVDEAGLLGTKDGLALLRVASELGARMVWSGDARQHAPISRGSAVTVLREYGGASSSWLQQIHRQRGAMKEVAELLNDGEVAKGLSKLTHLGMVKEHKEGDVFKEAASEYVRECRTKRKVIAIAPSRKEVREFNREVRELLKAKAVLKSPKMFQSLEPVDGTVADLSRANFYRKGQVVEFHKKAIGFAHGSRWKVVGTFSKAVIVRSGLVFRPLPLWNADRYRVFTPGSIELAAGEKVVLGRSLKTVLAQDDRWSAITATPVKSRFELQSGTQYEVKRFRRNGDIQLTNGLVIPKAFGHVRHGYCGTSISSQGMTVDHAVIVQTKAAGRAASREQFLVSVTRARDSVSVYTDDLKALGDAVHHVSSPTVAMDLTELNVRRPLKRPRDASRQSFEQTMRGEETYEKSRDREHER